MKCLAVFSSLPDLLYIWSDTEFVKHLGKMGVEAGITESLDAQLDLDEDMLQSFASHFFSPLVTSNKYMSQLGNSYRSIICENGFVFCMNEIGSLFFVAVCGDGEESEWYLQRKISFFNNLLTLHFGPTATDHLKPQYPMQRRQIWSTLSEFLETWQILCQQEQMFLVEALERLHVNQQLNMVSMTLLGEVLGKTKRDSHSLHALLLVNNKLLGLYSNEKSPELVVSDILMLIVLVKNKFRYDERTVPKSISRTPGPFSDSCMQLMDDKTLFGRFDGRNSATSPITVQTPRDVDRSGSSLSTSSKLDYHSANSSPLKPEIEENYFTPNVQMPQNMINGHRSDTDDSGTKRKLSDGDGKHKGEIADLASHAKDAGAGEDSAYEALPESDITEVRKASLSDYFQHTVFLQTRNCRYSPHTAHCILLDESTVLVIISQNRYVSFSGTMQSILRILQAVLKMSSKIPPSTREAFIDDLERLMDRLLEALDKYVELHTERFVHGLRLLEKVWKQAKESDMRTFVVSTLGSDSMPQRLETILTELTRNMKVMFSLLFVSTTHRRLSRYENQLKDIFNVRDMARAKLSHFGSFLHVRGQRNITITAYHNDLPGLVHFIYVNRCTDLLIAPTINVNQAEATPTHMVPLYVIIKQRIWDMWQYAETMLACGYTSMVVRDGDYTFSYFLWFEDAMGHPLHVQKSVKEVYKGKPTGILSGNFYRELISYFFPHMQPGSVQCYELLCMHVGIVSNHYVVSSCRKLAGLLYGASGEANSPISLL